MRFFKELWEFFAERFRYFMRVVKYSIAIAFTVGPIAALMVYFWPYSLAMGSGIIVCYIIMKNRKDLTKWITKQIERAASVLFDVNHEHNHI